MVEKIREEGEKWVTKQGEGIFIYLFLSPLRVTPSEFVPRPFTDELSYQERWNSGTAQQRNTGIPEIKIKILIN